MPDWVESTNFLTIFAFSIGGRSLRIKFSNKEAASASAPSSSVITAGISLVPLHLVIKISCDL